MEITLPARIEYSFHLSENPNVYGALLEAIDDFASRHTGLPDEVIMNAQRRVTEVQPQYWFTVYHGPIPIRLRSPMDDDIEPEIHGTNCIANFFICIRHIQPSPLLIDTTVLQQDEIKGTIHESAA